VTESSVVKRDAHSATNGACEKPPSKRTGRSEHPRRASAHASARSSMSGVMKRAVRAGLPGEDENETYMTCRRQKNRQGRRAVRKAGRGAGRYEGFFFLIIVHTL